MDDTYDVIVCGTGITECILSGLLSTEGKKVLHLDRNSFYGGEGASLNITALWKLFRPTVEPPKDYGANRDWNIDLISKFVMANGNLVKILLKTGVARYLEWKAADGTYVYQYKKGGIFSKAGGSIEKVPGNTSEALKSDLMSFFEKKRFADFFNFISKVDLNDPKTWDKSDFRAINFATLAKKYDLSTNTLDFIGHAVALYTNDDFLTLPAIETVERIKLYINSIGRYGDSPFIYPVYGLGGIPEGFSRLAAIYGGTFMLNKDIDEVVIEDGKVTGVKSGDEYAKAPIVICNPTYVLKTNKVKSIGKVVRCICILDHPLPNTNNSASVQIIIPQRQMNRNSDIYIMTVSNPHQVCKTGFYIAIVSALVETSNPEDELKPALDLIGSVREKFVTVSDLYVPTSDFSDNLYITKSLDPQSHFESATEDVMNLYKKITGKDLDLTNLPEYNDDQ